MTVFKSISVMGICLVFVAITALSSMAQEYKSPAIILNFGLKMEAEGDNGRATRAYQVVSEQYPDSKEATTALQRILAMKSEKTADERAKSARQDAEQARNEAARAAESRQKSEFCSGLRMCRASCTSSECQTRCSITYSACPE